MPYEHWLKDLGLINWRKEGGFLIKSALVKKLKEEVLNLFSITQRDRIRNNRTEGNWIVSSINSLSYTKKEWLLQKPMSAPHQQDVLEIVIKELK